MPSSPSSRSSAAFFLRVAAFSGFSFFSLAGLLPSGASPSRSPSCDRASPVSTSAPTARHSASHPILFILSTLPEKARTPFSRYGTRNALM